jgi:hypothetical protein
MRTDDDAIGILKAVIGVDIGIVQDLPAALAGRRAADFTVDLHLRIVARIDQCHHQLVT